MQTIEITNPIEARRCRYAQYRGEKATLMLNGLPVTGMVRSVREDASSTPMRWIVSVVPKQVIAALKAISAGLRELDGGDGPLSIAASD
jgi:hypothetical protein